MPESPRDSSDSEAGIQSRRFQNAKQAIGSAYAVVITLVTCDFVKFVAHGAVPIVEVVPIVMIALVALAIFLDKLELLECLHPDGRGYGFGLLGIDVAATALYAVMLTLLVADGVPGASRLAAYYFVYSLLFLVNLFRLHVTPGGMSTQVKWTRWGMTQTLLCGAFLSATASADRIVYRWQLWVLAVLGVWTMIMYLGRLKRSGRREMLRPHRPIGPSPSPSVDPPRT